MKDYYLAILTILVLNTIPGLVIAESLQIWVSSNNDPTITIEHNFGDICGWATVNPGCTVDWGDGETTSIDTPCITNSVEHTYSQNGEYTINIECTWNFLIFPDSASANISVSIRNASPCNNNGICEEYRGENSDNCPNDCKFVTINEVPIAMFEFSPINPEVDETVSFDARTSDDPDGTIVKYEWDFDGDGVYDMENELPMAQYTYTSPGNYYVTLRITDNDNAVNSTTNIISVTALNQLPIARFTFIPTTPFANQPVNFNASSSYDPDGTIVKYEWDFGDGNIDTGEIVSHTYQNAGTYTVKLTVTDNKNGSGDEIKIVNVIKPNDPPFANFTFSPQNPVAGESVFFNASPSHDPDGTIVKYEWDFGDGNIDTGEIVSHTYQNAGTYTVKLTVTDNNGTDSNISKTIYIETSNQPPFAKFIISPHQPSINQIVNFDASDSYDPDGTIVKYEWDFGDGETGNGPNINHSYKNPGNMNVTLKVTDNASSSSSITQIVKVRPKISFQIKKMQIVDYTNLQVDFLVIVSAFGDLTPQVTEFDYGDGNSGTYPGLKRETFHLYKNIGNFTATVRVKFTDGSVISDETIIENRGDGNLPPVADFSFSPLTPVVNESIFFDASPSYDPDGTIVKYKWDFDGDGVFEKEGKIATHRFYKTGNFNVRLMVIDNKNRENMIEKDVKVKNVRVSLNVIYKQNPYLVGFEVSLLGLGNRKVMKTTIDFGDGEVKTYTGLKSKFLHTYNSSGIYEVKIELVLNTGQIISDSSTVYIQSASEGRIFMKFELSGPYSANKTLKGKLRVTYTKFIPQDAVLIAYIDGVKRDESKLKKYLNDIDYYNFKKHVLRYRIVENGKNEWATYPEMSFNFSIKASGTRGSPPQNWESSPFSSSSSVNGGDGLKFIYDASKTITPPEDNNNDTIWEVFNNTNPMVNLTMRKACGNSSYVGRKTNRNGWIEIEFEDNNFQELPGTNHKLVSIDGGFDGYSLREPERRYFDGMGGVYKNDKYLEYHDYPSDTATGNNVYWNEEESYIIIFQYDANAKYKMVYMTPNGPNLCAYTKVADVNSSKWKKEKEFDVVVSYNKPFEANYTKEELLNVLKPDPCDKPNCKQSVVGYDVEKVYDSSNSINLKFNYSDNILTIKATTDSTELEREERFYFNLDTFENLTVPVEVGNHTLRMEILYEGKIIFGNSTIFYVCPDIDGDGFCEHEDCDDNNSAIHPGALELCNNMDDDCDGKIDEDFNQPGKILGTSCNDWPGSACVGVWMCNQNGTDVVCVSNYSIGEMNEICDDNIDNDCDGRIDEITETINGTLINGCVCKEGEKRICGSDVGFCRTGFRLCVNGVWTDCMGSRGPRKEICNTIDDDCNGIVDDIDGKMSVKETKCWCVNGANPRNEICNDIDDDCNGEIDDGIKCCKPGETRPCGTDIGICRKGKQMCVNGQWERKCIGAVEPREEICYNNLDDDCDGKIDEYCDISITCKNGVIDIGEEGIDCGGPCPQKCEESEISSWIYVSITGIILILIAGVLALTGKI